MANGQLPGSVAPTSIGQGKSYSEMVADQLGLIQQQRSANLEKRLAQEEKNREFRQQQQQNIYDFDVSGLPQAYIEKIGELQNQMASWLDPKAEVHYENSQQLTRDIAKLNNLYMSGKRLAAGGQAAMKNYEDRMTGKVKTPGVSFSGNEETYKNRQDAYNKGGFENMEIVGGPGDFNLMGVPLSEGENGMWGVAEGAEQVDILSAQIDPDALFRQEEIRDFINVEQKYVDASSSDMAAKQAESDFNSNPASVQAEFRAKLAAQDPKWGEINEDKTYSEGYTNEDLLKAYVAEATSGWDKFHETQLPTSLLGGSDVVTEYGAATKLTDPKTGKDRTVSLYTGGETREVNHIGFRGQGENTEVFYVYKDPNDPTQYLEAVVPYNSAEGFSLINDAGAISTIAKLVGNADLTLEELKDSIEEAPATTTEGTAGAEDTEGTTVDAATEGATPEATPEQQSEPAPDVIGDYRAALNEMAKPSGLGISWMQSSNQKFASRIKDLPIEEQIKETKKEIRRLQGIQAQERFKNPESYRRSSAWQKAGEALDGLASIQEAQEGLASPENINTRIDEAERLIAEKREELLDNQGTGTQKAERRRELEQEIQQLQGEISQLDPNYGADPQTPSERPETGLDSTAEAKPINQDDLIAEGGYNAAPELKGVQFDNMERALVEVGGLTEAQAKAAAAQAALESNHGASGLSKNHNNFFGLKPGSISGTQKALREAGVEFDITYQMTQENVSEKRAKELEKKFPERFKYIVDKDGNKERDEEGKFKVRVPQPFLSFPTPEMGIKGYVAWVGYNMPAALEAEDSIQYIDTLAQGAYATAARYEEKVLARAKASGRPLM